NKKNDRGSIVCLELGTRYPAVMVGLTDSQLKIVMTAANSLPVERRSVFLERVGAMLRMRGRFTDDDVADVAKLALTGLAQQPAA
ncbi:MAG: hypothetical protein WA725_08430, partial [Pseudolabrys sp.]